jgi:hypothetical protein
MHLRICHKTDYRVKFTKLVLKPLQDMVSKIWFTAAEKYSIQFSFDPIKGIGFL